jgi:2-polyprenyl-3-methyl-5-hydroxy-6-metoxy-1,4-benzoquinol methylase
MRSDAPREALPIETVDGICPLCRQRPTEAHAQGPDFDYGISGDRIWTLRRCSGCRVILLDPRPSESELQRIYPKDYYAYEFTEKQTIGHRVKTLLDRRAVRSYLRHPRVHPGNILDVGCGDGRLLRLFGDCGIPARNLYGMELNERAVLRARQQGLQVELGRFEDVTYGPEFFSLAVLQQVIEHVPDPRTFLRRLHRVLAPGGAAVIETPNIASWDHALFRRRYWGGYHIPRHFCLFDSASLARLMEEEGFEVVEARCLLSPMFWIQSVFHAMTEHGFPRVLRKIFDPYHPSVLALFTFAALDLCGKPFGFTSNIRVVGIRR